MILAAQILFWTCGVAVLASYFGYPLLLLVMRPLGRRHRMGEELPPVTLVISAYNEAGVIRDKIENTLALDYPLGRLEVLVISDESTDETDDIVREFADRGVRLFRQQPRRGKSYGLTQFVPEATGDIVVFSDANSMYEPLAIRKLVRHFEDPEVGFAVGHQRYVEDGLATTVSESLYWKYETRLKILESRIGSVVCGDGAIYAIRAELFEPLREDDINDFTIPLKIVARGYRGVFDEEAICYEHTAEDFHGEFRRKMRIVNRSFRAVTRVRAALNPFRVGRFALQLLVHKILRWLVPFFLVGALVTSSWLAWEGLVVYQLLLLVQLAFYALALLGTVPGLKRVRLFYIPYYFCLINLAAGLGVSGVVLGKKIVTWTPERAPETEKEAVDPTPVAARK